MSYTTHHAIIVTGMGKPIHEAHAKALDIGCTCTPLVKSQVNGWLTFTIVPDGSKEEWAHSEAGDIMREEFKTWAKSQIYDDGDSPFSWVEVQYGDEANDDTRIIDDCELHRR